MVFRGKFNTSNNGTNELNNTNELIEQITLNLNSHHIGNNAYNGIIDISDDEDDEETINENNETINENTENDETNNDDEINIPISHFNTNNRNNVTTMREIMLNLHAETGYELIMHNNHNNQNTNHNTNHNTNQIINNNDNAVNIIKHVGIYTRVSTKQQNNDGQHSLNSQQNKCNNFVKNNFNSVDTTFISEIGSSYNNCNKLSKLTNYVNKMQENTVIFISDISRLGRNVFQVMKILEKIQQKKSYVVSYDEKIAFNYDRYMNTQFQHRVIDATAENDKRSINAKNIHRHIRLLGGHVGRAPFGKKTIPKIINEEKISIIVDDDKQQEIIKNIINIFKTTQNYTKTTKIINESLDKPLSIATVRKIIKNKTTVDKLTINKLTVDKPTKININKPNDMDIDIDKPINTKKIKVSVLPIKLITHKHNLRNLNIVNNLHNCIEKIHDSNICNSNTTKKRKLTSNTYQDLNDGNNSVMLCM